MQAAPSLLPCDYIVLYPQPLLCCFTKLTGTHIRPNLPRSAMSVMSVDEAAFGQPGGLSMSHGIAGGPGGFGSAIGSSAIGSKSGGPASASGGRPTASVSAGRHVGFAAVGTAVTAAQAISNAERPPWRPGGGKARRGATAADSDGIPSPPPAPLPPAPAPLPPLPPVRGARPAAIAVAAAGPHAIGSAEFDQASESRRMTWAGTGAEHLDPNAMHRPGSAKQRQHAEHGADGGVSSPGGGSPTAEAHAGAAARGRALLWGPSADLASPSGSDAAAAAAAAVAAGAPPNAILSPHASEQPQHGGGGGGFQGFQLPDGAVRRGCVAAAPLPLMSFGHNLKHATAAAADEALAAAAAAGGAPPDYDGPRPYTPVPQALPLPPRAETPPLARPTPPAGAQQAQLLSLQSFAPRASDSGTSIWANAADPKLLHVGAAAAAQPPQPPSAGSAGSAAGSRQSTPPTDAEGLTLQASTSGNHLNAAYGSAAPAVPQMLPPLKEEPRSGAVEGQESERSSPVRPDRFKAPPINLISFGVNHDSDTLITGGGPKVLTGSVTAGGGAAGSLAARPPSARRSTSGQNSPHATVAGMEEEFGGAEDGAAGGPAGRRLAVRRHGSRPGSPLAVTATVATVAAQPPPVPSWPRKAPGTTAGGDHTDDCDYSSDDDSEPLSDEEEWKRTNPEPPDEATLRVIARAEIYERFGMVFAENQGHRMLAITFWVAVSCGGGGPFGLVECSRTCVDVDVPTETRLLAASKSS